MQAKEDIYYLKMYHYLFLATTFSNVGIKIHDQELSTFHNLPSFSRFKRPIINLPINSISFRSSTSTLKLLLELNPSFTSPFSLFQSEKPVSFSVQSPFLPHSRIWLEAWTSSNPSAGRQVVYPTALSHVCILKLADTTSQTKGQLLSRRDRKVEESSMGRRASIFRNNSLNFILLLNLSLLFPSGNISACDFMWNYSFLTDLQGGTFSFLFF